jgi:hypothetical protein
LRKALEEALYDTRLQLRAVRWNHGSPAAAMGEVDGAWLRSQEMAVLGPSGCGVLLVTLCLKPLSSGPVAEG